ncbi:hypothetical protein EG329_003636 [Mollisiaceae sp. DMI_Dod_QoI]|nr:hypothetical protein EG329_003636 [Helotiales sp. DMI_Dod_QoI]
MWPNGFGNNGHFQNNFNPDDYQPISFGGPPSQQFFPQQGMAMQFDDPNGDELMEDDYQPELALPNHEAFIQNQNISAQFSPSTFMASQVAAPIAPRVPTQMNARAAELKAELLKRKGERASSATPPIPTSGPATKQTARTETSNAKHRSPNTSKLTDEKREQDLNDLISQYSEPTPLAGTTVKQEKKISSAPNIQQIPPNPVTSAKSQVPSLGPAKVTKPDNKGNPHINETTRKVLGSRHASNGSVSEGEILEDTIPRKAALSQQMKEAQTKIKLSQSEEQPSRTLREDQNSKQTYARLQREEPRRHTPSPSPKAQLPNGRDDRREEVDSRNENRSYQDNSKVERKHHSEAEKQLVPRRDPGDEENRQPQSNGILVQAEPKRQIREQNAPTLIDLLPHDEDLREWLDITGYHNAPYRNKILNRRRAIAALDAQRDKLLAEMEAEERGGVPAALAQQPVSSMLPPPIPNKLGARAESVPTPSIVESQRDRVVSNKRPYSELQDARENPIAEKIPRVEERNYAPRVKEENDYEYRRPRSSGLDSGRRFSPARRDDSDMPRQRFEGRGRSRERDMSPGRRAYDSRPPARGRGYESDSFYDRDDPLDRGRSHESRGGYKGKSFDPNFRSGRGRGRARGDSRDSRDYQPGEFKNDSPFGSRIANGRPYRDTKGFDRGGRGDTRYFIVKSFNEENVLKCIQDSVWTTQVQNGSIFKEAFETCRNVILVFSINKSRAFQGYARMESLPGSVEVPEWQRSINWESAGAFKVRWLVICSTRFHRVGHLKNAYNENQAVLIGKDGQEIEENCGAGLIELIDEEADQALGRDWVKSEDRNWDEHY